MDDGLDRAGGPLTKERSRICRKAEHYMLHTLARQANADDTCPCAAVLQCAAATVVIDTNALLDWLVFADPAVAALACAVTNGQVRWVATTEMLDELSSVLARPLAECWEIARKRALTLNAAALCEHWPGPTPQASVGLRCRDPADQKFVDLAVACRARALITRDRALLDLRRRAQALGVSIVAPAQWAGTTSATATAR